MDGYILLFNIDGSDNVEVRVKNGIRFDGVVTLVQAAGGEFEIRGKVIGEVKNEGKNKK